MVQRYIIVDQTRLNYEGLFDMRQLFGLINSWNFEKGYDRREKRNEQGNYPDGRTYIIEMFPWKKISDYFRNVVRIRIFADHVKDVEIEKNGNKLRLQHGRVQIIMSAFLETDWQERWEKKAILFFIRAIVERYLMKEWFKKHEANIIADFNDIHTKIKNFLNIYKFEGEFRPQWG